MQILNGLDEIKNAPQGCAVTLGIFDGVHLGHQKVIGRTVELGRGGVSVPEAAGTGGAGAALAADGKRDGVGGKGGGENAGGRGALVITFDTHPRALIAPQTAPQSITSLTHRLRLFERLGVAATLILPFDERIAALSAEEFVRQILCVKLAAQAVVLGKGARFGKGRAGDFALLKRLAPQCGFACEEVSPVAVDGERVSSTAIRAAVTAGRLDVAARMLGREVSVLGTVGRGAQIGRTLGFPTLNLDPAHELHPPRGVYVTETVCQGDVWQSVTNIGHRPTVSPLNCEDVLIESHILGANVGELYGAEAEVKFLKRLRGESKFPNREALMFAIAADVKAAQDFFRGR